MVNQIIFFLNSANLICRTTDISKYFRESLGVRDNESTVHKTSVRIEAPNSVNASKRKHKDQINHNDKQRRVLMANSTVCRSKCKPIVEPRRAKPKTYNQAPTHGLKIYEEAVIESEARTAVVQLKNEA